MAVVNPFPKSPQAGAPLESPESAVLTVLKTAQHQRQTKTRLHERTVRMRRKGEPDRRFLLACAIDPDDDKAVIFRIRPASERNLGPVRAPMLSTQQAADLLNVSRPYIVKLVGKGAFRGVERTQAGHRRIPSGEVERIRQEMQTSRRAALDRIETLTSDLSAQELAAARASAKRRWIKPRPAKPKP
jgi:excisionase family DNA binding protein